jgi:hypothetical protein
MRDTLQHAVHAADTNYCWAASRPAARAATARPCPSSTPRPQAWPSRPRASPPPEVLVGLVNVDDVHEAGGVGGVRAHLGGGAKRAIGARGVDGSYVRAFGRRGCSDCCGCFDECCCCCHGRRCCRCCHRCCRRCAAGAAAAAAAAPLAPLPLLLRCAAVLLCAAADSCSLAICCQSRGLQDCRCSATLAAILCGRQPVPRALSSCVPGLSTQWGCPHSPLRASQPAHLAVNLDQPLHEDGLDLLSGERIPGESTHIVSAPKLGSSTPANLGYETQQRVQRVQRPPPPLPFTAERNRRRRPRPRLPPGCV